jgi:hypothetical protein
MNRGSSLQSSEFIQGPPLREGSGKPIALSMSGKSFTGDNRISDHLFQAGLKKVLERGFYGLEK